MRSCNRPIPSDSHRSQTSNPRGLRLHSADSRATQGTLGHGHFHSRSGSGRGRGPRCLTPPGTVPSQLGALMLRFLEPSATASRTMPSFDCCGRSFPVKSSRVHMTKSWLLFRQEPCSLPVLRAFHLATLNGGSFLALLKDRGDQPPICVCQVRKRKPLISHLPSR